MPVDAKALHVLVVDDSAVVRQVVTGILGRVPGVTVATAADPLIAFRKIKERRPNVIVLDLVLPHMSGLTFLEKIMADDPIPVVVCSAEAQKGSAASVRALQAGALDIVAKPELGVRDFLHDSAVYLVDAVLGASQARLRPASPSCPAPASSQRTTRVKTAGHPHSSVVVALGASTGGPEALGRVLSSLPADSPGIVVVQHMPKAFTAAFAAHLDSVCTVAVREAKDGDEISRGTALIAAGGQHLTVARTRTGYRVHTSDDDPVARHRPSVDVLFRSVARAAGSRSVGVIMTGMGNDGAAGLLEMRHAGARTFAQDETSSVVYGMPREALRLGAAAATIPLEGLAAAILSAAASIDASADRRS